MHGCTIHVTHEQYEKKPFCCAYVYRGTPSIIGRAYKELRRRTSCGMLRKDTSIGQGGAVGGPETMVSRAVRQAVISARPTVFFFLSMPRSVPRFRPHVRDVLSQHPDGVPGRRDAP